MSKLSHSEIHRVHRIGWPTLIALRANEEQQAGHRVASIALGEFSCEDNDCHTLQFPCDNVVIASGARPG